MKSSVVKRSILVGGHKTSVSLEEPFWIELKKIALTQKVTMVKLVTKIDHTREQGNLSSAIRLFVLTTSVMRQGNGRSPLLHPR